MIYLQSMCFHIPVLLAVISLFKFSYILLVSEVMLQHPLGCTIQLLQSYVQAQLVSRAVV